MIFICCTLESCGFTARIHAPIEGEAESLLGPSSNWYPDKYPCPKCSSNCVMSTKQMNRLPVTDLTPLEAFAAFSGVGLPTEHETSAAEVCRLLEGSTIKQAFTRHIPGTNRGCLDKLVLEDGTVLFIGASSHGASVYRIQKPGTYVPE